MIKGLRVNYRPERKEHKVSLLVFNSETQENTVIVLNDEERLKLAHKLLYPETNADSVGGKNG